MKNRLVTHPKMMVKNQEEYFDCRSSPLKSAGPQIRTGLSSSEHQCQEAVKVSPAMKVSVGSVQVKQRADVDLDVHLKGLHTDSPLTVILSSSKGTASLKVAETYREELNYLVLGHGLEK